MMLMQGTFEPLCEQAGKLANMQNASKLDYSFIKQIANSNPPVA